MSRAKYKKLRFERGDFDDRSIFLLIPVFRWLTSRECVRDDFSWTAWNRNATDALLGATDGVDDLCRTLVRCSKLPISSAVGDEIRRLSLTVATLERSIYAYVTYLTQLKQRAKEESIQASCQLSTSGNKASSAHNSLSSVPGGSGASTPVFGARGSGGSFGPASQPNTPTFVRRGFE